MLTLLCLCFLYDNILTILPAGCCIRITVKTENLLLREARDQFLAVNGFRVSDYFASTYTVKLLGIPFRFPNTEAHQWATPLHDLHHVLTGYQTSWIGEAELAAWELRAGCKTLVVYWLNLSGIAIGLLIAPLRVWHAFRAARGCRTLYRHSELREAALKMTVGEARLQLGIPMGGARQTRPTTAG